MVEKPGMHLEQEPRWSPEGLLGQMEAPKLFSDTTIASISKKVNISEVRGKLMRSNLCRSSPVLIYRLSVMDFDPKGTISEVRGSHWAVFGHTGCWSIAKCSRFSTKFSSSRSFDHHGKTKKEIVKDSFEKWKKSERSRRSVRKIDEYVIDYACEDGCVKVTNVKSVKKCSPWEGGGGGREKICDGRQQETGFRRRIFGSMIMHDIP